MNLSWINWVSRGKVDRVNQVSGDKAARCGEPSYVWRAGQERRLQMLLQAAGERMSGNVLENGCGIGLYVKHLQPHAGRVWGLEYEFDRARQAREHSSFIVCAAGETLPYPDQMFDIILSHEVIEHVRDDRRAVREMVRVLKPGGRIILFCPNRGYPFETHGFYWRGTYHFGNIPLLNYLPRPWRNTLAPHVRVYNLHDLEQLFSGQPVKVIQRRVIFGGYDNLVQRLGLLGRIIRVVLQGIENTPLSRLGLSHFWVVERLAIS